MVKRLAVMVVLALALTASQAKAVIITPCTGQTLDELLNLTQGCTIEDKLFVFTSYDVSAGGDTAAAANIQVRGITDPFNFGVGFQLTGIGGANLVNAGGSLLATLAYTVSVLDPLAFLITDLHLGYTVSGDVLGVVTETATTVDTNLTLGVLCVGTNKLICAGLGLRDVNEVVFGPVSALSVVKVLNLTSVCNLTGDCGSVNNVSQVVTQQAVPEPASMLLLGTGLAGLAMRRRRRAQQQSQL